MLLSTDENLPPKQNTADEVTLNIPENNDSITRSIVQEMSVDILNKIEERVIIEPFPVSKSSLTRGVNGLKLDDKTIRTIACLYYKTEDLNALLNLVPDCLKETITNANNKLSHQGLVSYEIARNPELIQLWNLCSGNGCTRAIGKNNFNEKFDMLIEILVEHKLVTKSLLIPDCWIASGDMMSGREDFVYHYEHMFNLTKARLKNPAEGKVIQFCGEMSRASFAKLQEKMVELYYEYVQADSLLEATEKELKFNFQASLCEMGTNEVQNEIQ